MDIKLASALNYYGFKNLQQAKERFGLYSDVDIRRFLIECYEEDLIDNTNRWIKETLERINNRYEEE